MNNVVETKRYINTPSEFAKNSLLFVQEIGSSRSLKKHTSSRNSLNSYLLLIVTNGNGILKYNSKEFLMENNDIAFIDCNNEYSHTSDNWNIEWVHFNGNNMEDIYSKYKMQGKTVFKSNYKDIYLDYLNNISDIIEANNIYTDLEINKNLSSLLSTLFSENMTNLKNVKQTYDVRVIKDYIDKNFLKDISLDFLSKKFLINKFYLTRLFKKNYSITINDYITQKRITKSKELLRFSDKTITQISNECNIGDANYYSRVFKKIENITPKQYRNKW